jgi:hypothetical protein
VSDRGFVAWKPSDGSLKLLGIIQAVLAEYRDYLPLTLRQVFYRAVGQHGYDKTEAAYKRLGRTAVKARRAQMIPFSALRDDGVTIRPAPGYDDLADFEGRIRAVAETYSRQRLQGQQRLLMVLCEAAGMVPQIARVAHEFGVEVRSSGGYDSLTAKYELAGEIVGAGIPVTILHLGDLDPSGEDIFTNIEEDVGAFVRQMAVDDDVEMKAVRIAVTRSQALALDLPTTPPKTTDSRAKNFDGETVQCEAIPPNLLNEIVRDEIRSRLDLDIFAANLALEARDSQHIAKVMTHFSLLEGRA